MSAGVLLDTHVLVWLRREPDLLRPGQRAILEEAEARQQPVGISAITLWELAKLVERGRLSIRRPVELWLEELERHPLVRVYPITARIAALSTQLGEDFHKDPADQIIVATARAFGLKLLTSDERIRRWGKVQIV